MNDKTIIVKCRIGFRPTHNPDGKYQRVWRLLADGTVERTNSNSRYMRYVDSETVPAQIIAAAAKADIAILPGRPEWRRKARKPAASKRSESIAVKLTPAELAGLQAGAEKAGLSMTDFIARKR